MYQLSPVLFWFWKREFQKQFSRYRRLFQGVKPPGCKAAPHVQQMLRMSWAVNPRFLLPPWSTHRQFTFTSMVLVTYCSANIYFFVKKINIYCRRQPAVSIKRHARPGSCRGSVRIYERPAARAWRTRWLSFYVQSQQEGSEIHCKLSSK
jgi:hypothetical protein